MGSRRGPPEEGTLLAHGLGRHPRRSHSLAQVFSQLLTREVLGQLWDLRGCGQRAPVSCALSGPSRPITLSLTESHGLLPEDHHQATELSSCPHSIPSQHQAFRRFPLTVSNLCAHQRRQTESCVSSLLCHSLSPLHPMHSQHFLIQRDFHPNCQTPRSLMFRLMDFIAELQVEARHGEQQRLFRARMKGDRSGLGPVAATAAGVKDKPGLAVLQVSDAI